jgi:effector-binding domain-containing protein
VKRRLAAQTWHAAVQLRPLNRILVLKDLGFTLAEITRIVKTGVSNDELVGMLRLRQAEAERQAETEQRRLKRVAARIDILRGVPDMNDTDAAIVIRSLNPVRLAVASEPAGGFDDDFAPIFARLHPHLFEALEREGIQPAGPTYGLYDERSDGRIDVVAGVVISPTDEITTDEVTTRDLPAASRAATLIHEGSIETVIDSYAILDRWIQAADEQPVGFSREVYLVCPEHQADWVTELQFVLA